MVRDNQGHLRRQLEHFEGRPSLLERLIKNPSYPRTMRKKIRFVARSLVGCERVLEVGSGHGLELGLFLAEIGETVKYVGIDLATAALRHANGQLARDRPTAFLAAAVERLPFRDGSFDGAFCVDVLHHAQSQPAMLAEIRRVLSPGGRLVCVEPNPIFPTNIVYLRNPVENGLFKFTRQRAIEWTAAAGLADVRVTHIPVFFPSFPATLGGPYERLERILGALPGIRGASTTRVLTARRPASG
ncbi:MAG: class I SAM-dependent methyltransferase [Chloroflexi bacterium]|nr:class I SAM-dependent methyltransferase [Chloroflexota bacterium]